MGKTKKIIVVVATLLFCLNVFMTLSGIAFGFINFIDIHRYYVHKGGSKVANEIWIMPIISEDDKVLSLFPFFGYRYIGSPYGIGLRAVDYDNKYGCTKMEIHKLVLKSKDSTFEVIKGNADPIVIEFEKYLSDIDHVHAKWFIPAGEWLEKRNKETVTFQAKYKIYTKNGIVEDDIEVTYKLQSISRFSMFYDMGH